MNKQLAMIPPELLANYVKEGILAPYDQNAKLRILHRKEMERWRQSH